MENKEQEVCNNCGKTIREQLKGCAEITCYRQFLSKQSTNPMENKTAVQIFFEDLCHLGYIEYPDESLVQDRLNLALELEKDQIINAHLTGLIYPLEMEATKQATEYYFETYKKPTE